MCWVLFCLGLLGGICAVMIGVVMDTRRHMERREKDECTNTV